MGMGIEKREAGKNKPSEERLDVNSSELFPVAVQCRARVPTSTTKSSSAVFSLPQRFSFLSFSSSHFILFLAPSSYSTVYIGCVKASIVFRIRLASLATAAVRLLSKDGRITVSVDCPALSRFTKITEHEKIVHKK